MDWLLLNMYSEDFGFGQGGFTISVALVIARSDCNDGANLKHPASPCRGLRNQA